MLTTLLLHFIRASYALPIGDSAVTPTPDNGGSTRTVPGIVWSCLTTIFACTWIAVHPNLPNPEERNSKWANFRRRLRIFLIALIAPEYIIAWAVGQSLHARGSLMNLRKFDPCKNWTLTHGFFLTMGGFELADEHGRRLGVLEESSLALLLLENRAALPPISAAEIDDKSKGDAIGKLLVLTQTTWFMAQVVSRAIQKLPMTELELTTVAFASLNIITYILWWKKPLDVQHPIVLNLLDTSPQLLEAPKAVLPGPQVGVPCGNSRDSEFPVEPAPEAGCHDSPVQDSTSVEGFLPHFPWEVSPCSPSEDGNDTESSEFTETPTNQKPGVQTRATPFVRRTRWHLSRAAILLVRKSTENVVFALASGSEIYEPIDHVDLPANPHGCQGRHPVRVSSKLPTFYRGRKWDPSSMSHIQPYWHYQIAAETSIGALFGAIHCAAWTFIFPTHCEEVLWRVISLYITLAPLYLAMTWCIEHGIRRLRKENKHQGPDARDSPSSKVRASRLLGDLINTQASTQAGVLLILLFIIARIATFICAFVLLHDLPQVHYRRFNG